MIPESHIKANVRKRLCGRLFYLDTVHSHKDFFYQCGAGSTLDALRNTFFSFIDEEISAKSNEGVGDVTDRENVSSDEAFLAKFVSHISRTVEPILERHPQLLEVVKQSIQQRESEISCTNCCSAVPLEGADNIVGDTGCCIAPLRQMFVIAREAAKIYYSSFSSFPQAELPEVVFSTKHFRDLHNLHDLPIQYSVSGAVKFSSLSEKIWSEVQLWMHIDGFGFDSYMAAPYVLFHECIAHAFHGIIPLPINREVNAPDDEFAEGWMDFVAFKVLEEVMQGKGPANHLTSTVKFTREHHHRCNNLHMSRIELDVAPPNKPSQYAIRRKSGYIAANKVLSVLERLPESCQHPWEAFLRMSFDLNMLQAFYSTQRQQFVALINNLSKLGELDTPRHCDIVPIIRKYLINNDAETLVQEILKLKTLWAKKKARSENKGNFPLLLLENKYKHISH